MIKLDNESCPQELISMSKVELHQHVDGSIPVDITWKLMKKYRLNPVDSIEEMEKLLVLQEDEEGTLIRYLDKFHYPQWVTQFYENIQYVVDSIIDEAVNNGVKLLEIRYSPIIHTYSGLTLRQTITSVLSSMNNAKKRHDIKVGLIVIAMRQHGPHIAKILARQAISEAQHLHSNAGVIGFDIAGAERGNYPGIFKEAYKIAKKGGLGLTAHAGEDEGAEYIWQAIDELGVTRIGHACSAVNDKALLKRLANDKILVECCITSNFQTGAVKRNERHPIFTFLAYGVPVAICTDNTTVSNTNQNKENAYLFNFLSLKEIEEIHKNASLYSFLEKT